MERFVQVILCLCLPWMASGKTWHVRQAGTGHPIQHALDLAAPGDTILVDKGIYTEKGLVIRKPVCLRGIDWPILDGEKQYEILAVSANDVVVEGFHFQYSGVSGWHDIAGVKIYNAHHVTIRSNILDHTFFGIYCLGSSNCTLSGNTIHSDADNDIQSGNGIHCWKCDSMRILDNEITRHRDGIYFEFVTHSLIRGNRSFSNARYGLHFMFSHNNVYERNLFRHNEAGVSVMFSHGVTMLGNTFTENWGGSAYGILMKEITDSKVIGNHFLNNTSGIYMEGTTRILVTENTFSGNGWAMKIQASCSDDVITRNNFNGNTFDIATNGSLVLNTFNANYWDKYEGYDLGRDGIGDVPYHPVSLYSMIAEKNPTVMMLYHSFMVGLLDKSEKVIPSITPEALRDDKPFMKPLRLP
ncbi:MAG: nitrous oxide reductase family maturation protein NosD [Bacteroidota bacterium]|nr:nitrous oxide reductase family maturation protein NosD [Bacteroidota bacterium]MDP4216564.1 nitrous oxide reductase family maturation protein NosD [Bacteroidota bacterium]MDP4245028.1 nitrous oxide reductase family maturation protein NosD [Bacteroidota bacterium]MDP4252863.1 nitrous oxide reductase family maturation protein NosD [Bacteroidota bacterium]MDP4259855.1 nitrous oxide reductase family maturation protein NosD [Bacteroidota bacterium]